MHAGSMRMMRRSWNLRLYNQSLTSRHAYGAQTFPLFIVRAYQYPSACKHSWLCSIYSQSADLCFPNMKDSARWTAFVTTNIHSPTLFPRVVCEADSTQLRMSQHLYERKLRFSRVPAMVANQSQDDLIEARAHPRLPGLLKTIVSR